LTNPGAGARIRDLPLRSTGGARYTEIPTSTKEKAPKEKAPKEKILKEKVPKEKVPKEGIR
jgi:hypothetical protein